MTICGERTVVKYYRHRKEAASLRCRSWLCEDCYPMRRRALIARMIAGQPDMAITLTLRRVEGKTPEEAARELSRAWRLLRLRIMRRHGGQKLPFICAMEAHKSGWPHLHILLRSKFIPWKWLSDQMADIADSPHVHVQRLDHAGRASAYASKYAGKCAHKFATAKRYWSSQDWDLSEYEHKRLADRSWMDWEVLKVTLREWVQRHVDTGWTVRFNQKGHAIATRFRGEAAAAYGGIG